MQIGHQHLDVAMRGNEIVIHVARMAGGVAESLQAVDPRKAADEPGETPSRTVWPFAAIGIHVLAEERDLARAVRGQAARFGLDLRNGARELGAPRIGHDAEGAKLVATL